MRLLRTKPKRTLTNSASPISILQACRDPNLFGPWFKERQTWLAWFAFLAALFAIPMTREQRAIYRACTGREYEPDKAATEAWLVIGRRGGKSFILALIAVFLACFKDYRRYLAPGERGVVMVVAADRKQARIVLRYVRGLLTNVPMLRRLIESESKEAFDLTNQTSIEVHTASYRSTRGYTLVAVIADEIAFWPVDENSAEPDREVLNALRPGLATIPGSMLLCASSPYARRGELWNAHRRHHGKDGDPVLVWQASTKQMNPTISGRFLEQEFERDPASAAAEYGAEFRSDVASFVDRATVEACVSHGIRERPPMSGVPYVAFVDPSGGASDSMTLCIGHREPEIQLVVLDALREVRPRFDPNQVTAEFCALLELYGIVRVHGDRYGGEWPRERFRNYGITYEIAEKSKSQIYLETLPLLNTRGIQLLDEPRLVNQLCSLERKTTRGTGRDIIDHPPSGHDDVCNAAMGCAALLTIRKRTYDGSLAWVLSSHENEPAPLPPPKSLDEWVGRLNQPEGDQPK